ncbi:hypothetical protein BGY98DRAFT_989111, partial [Russula aff. rugulosa BPL654]
MNILVATPGRLSNTWTTVGFYYDNLQMLDPCSTKLIVFLTWVFSRTLSALLGHFPKSRQTLLFSATQTQTVFDLARLSLRDPVFISTDAAASTTEGSTHLELPAGLGATLCYLQSR